jgi:DNA-binding beta-propeller fold protein YncE
MDDTAPATTVSAVAQGGPATAHRLTRSRAMRTATGLVYVTNQNDSTVSVVGP